MIPSHMDKNFNVYIEQNIRTVRVKEGEDLSLKCSANSSVGAMSSYEVLVKIQVPAYVLGWFKDGKEVSGPATTSNTNGVLVLKNLGQTDSGYYRW